MTSQISIEEKRFYSEGEAIASKIYLPEDFNSEKEYTAILLCHGFAGVQDFLLPTYAENFAGNGFIAITFDYRGFGESSGRNGFLSKKNQIEDIRNALVFTESIKYVNAIVLWGTSYGGANVIETASIEQHKLKGVIAQIAFGNGSRVIFGDKTEAESEKLMRSIDKILSKQVLNNRTLSLPIKKFMNDEQSQKFLNENHHPSMDQTLSFSTMRETIEHKPENLIAKVNIPILLVGAEKDSVNPVQETKSLYEKANDPKKLFIVDNAGHFDLYFGEYFKVNFEKQLAWLLSLN
ncbi:Pimeloyl-ACP methyl ester carboxylesterase [Tenacibaculum sp. MAR_2009_124]|uniref:alpha/beta hydrolase n=1 Tax=Tenacibaculum sp. MAR_2009_124 TaxID=1250059 RepID=UPI0008977B99|nr:alpha/beta fold hydrolase [Tenacibaculum sp. MAR_2009_124]SEC95296.1 Pimeloyl-ACP methyl ester carboxylesterase [Tenacibaculum sp. MAR_2009_124]